MEDRKRDYLGHRGRYRRLTIVLVCVLLVLAVGVVGFSLTEAKTEKKAQKINSKEVKAENKDSSSEKKNPLKLDQYPELTEAVKVYYSGLPTDKDFMESYDNIQVYTKLGKYKNTYVAFVKYEMKIKDVYTKVPGLETLFVEKNKKDGKYSVSSGVTDQELKAFVQQLTAHEDVASLMSEVETAYQIAVQSDALLREALQDLKNAYENSAGTSSSE